MNYDIIIIGSGAAGLAAALYTGRYNMQTLIIQGEFGGETATAWKIENYPGVKSIDGYELMKIMKEQAKELGATFERGKVEKITSDKNCFTVFTRDKEFKGNSIILATGSQRRHLDLFNEKELTGKGVHYCWTCDGPLYKGKTIAMVGGGNSSVKGINFLAEYAEKIYLIVKESEMQVEPMNLKQMEKLKDKVKVLLETEVKEIIAAPVGRASPNGTGRGEKKLEKLVLSKEFQGSKDLVVDGLFVEIGFNPDTTLANQLGLELDKKGYIMVDNMMQTNVPGIFAAGDVTNHFGRFKQDITASALGAVAATSAFEYLKESNNNQ